MQAVAKTPIIYTRNQAETLERIERDGGALTVMTIEDSLFYAKSTRCKYIASEADVSPLDARYYFYKDRPALVARFNAAIRQNRVNIRVLVDKYERYARKRREEDCRIQLEAAKPLSRRSPEALGCANAAAIFSHMAACRLVRHLSRR